MDTEYLKIYELIYAIRSSSAINIEKFILSDNDSIHTIVSNDILNDTDFMFTLHKIYIRSDTSDARKICIKKVMKFCNLCTLLKKFVEQKREDVIHSIVQDINNRNLLIDVENFITLDQNNAFNTESNLNIIKNYIKNNFVVILLCIIIILLIMILYYVKMNKKINNKKLDKYLHKIKNNQSFKYPYFEDSNM